MTYSNVMIIIINDDDDDDVFSFYLFEYCDLWYDKLGYMNYNCIQRLINLELLPSMVFE
jgi:hypothetical protein